MEIPGQGNLFDEEPKGSNSDEAKKSELDSSSSESVPTKEESIAWIKHILSYKGREELKAQRLQDTEKKHQIKEEEAEAMARAKELEAEGRYEYNDRESAIIKEEARKRLSVRKAREIREMLAQKRANENSESSDRDSSPDSL